MTGLLRDGQSVPLPGGGFRPEDSATTHAQGDTPSPVRTDVSHLDWTAHRGSSAAWPTELQQVTPETASLAKYLQKDLLLRPTSKIDTSGTPPFARVRVGMAFQYT